MNSQQRSILSESLSQLDYPILSKHAITAEPYLTNLYLRLAWQQAARRKRYDILGNIYQSKLFSLIVGKNNEAF